MSNSGEFTGAKIRAEYCQSLLPMPGVAVLAGVKGPRVGPGSALGGHGESQMGYASQHQRGLTHLIAFQYCIL